MGTIGQHVTMRLEDDRTITKSPPERRRAARAILGIAEEFQLIAFRCADSHMHLLVPGPKSQASEFARRAKIRVGKGLKLDVPFNPAAPERSRAAPAVSPR
jgi:REP element-mobilizing transposase RayT